MTDKAQRATISIGNLEVEGFMMPDGSYRMSQTQAAEIIGKDEINARRFLDSKGIKALLGKGYTPDSIEVESSQRLRGQTRINALPLEVVSAFWVWQCSQGNKQAIALVMAMTTETLERRFDNAFGYIRTEEERDQRLTKRLQETEQRLSLLSEAYAEPDIAREHISRLEEQVRQLGGEPWQPPSET
ncbi:MAG: hypothetical protein F6K42_14900 [Leptolyngbya sp. SIO1D8]|nr:hypothetical protein [Leptolyngbya sp. SIO1D8]